MKRTTLVLTVFAAAMVMALMMVAMALPVFAGGAGDDEDNDNESANGGSTRNGQIVFRRYFDPDRTKGALFTMNPDGSHVRQITHPPEGWRDDAPAWSPDGERIAFHRQTVDESTSRIMLLNPQTGNTRQVTHSVPQGKQCTSQCLGGLDPAFSPEGDSLSFHRIVRPDKACCEIEGIWIIGTDGSDPHQLTNVDPKLPAVYADWGSAFSPDGEMLVFDRLRKADEHHAIFVQPIDSSGSPQDAHRITPWNQERIGDRLWLRAGLSLAGSALSLALIHRSAWKENS